MGVIFTALCCGVGLLNPVVGASNTCADYDPQTCDLTRGCVSCYGDDAVDTQFTCTDVETATIQQTRMITIEDLRVSHRRSCA